MDGLLFEIASYSIFDLLIFSLCSTCMLLDLARLVCGVSLGADCLAVPAETMCLGNMKGLSDVIC